MRPPLDITRQREEDAALFEDWSEWHCLDGRSREPNRYREGRSPAPRAEPPEGGWCEYWLTLLPDTRRFYLKVCCGEDQVAVSHLPGAVLQRKDRYDLSRAHWYVPFAAWRELRALLPGIKARTIAHIEARRADLARHERRKARAVARVAAGLKGETLDERLLDLDAAILVNRWCVNQWEFDFVVSVAAKRARGRVLTERQSTAIERVHGRLIRQEAELAAKRRMRCPS